MTHYDGFDIRTKFAAAICSVLCTLTCFIVAAQPVSKAMSVTSSAAVVAPLA